MLITYAALMALTTATALGLLDYSSDVCFTHAAYFSASTTVVTGVAVNASSVLFQSSKKSGEFVVQCMHVYETPPYNADGTVSSNPYWGTCTGVSAPTLQVCSSDTDVFAPQGGQGSSTLAYTFDTSSVSSTCYDVSGYLYTPSNYLTFGTFGGPARYWRVQHKAVAKGPLCYPLWIHFVAITNQAQAEGKGEPLVWIIVVCVAAFVVLLILIFVAAVCFSDSVRKLFGLRLRNREGRSASLDSNVYAGQTLEDLPPNYEHVENSPNTTFSPSRHVPRANLAGLVSPQKQFDYGVEGIDTDTSRISANNLGKQVELVDMTEYSPVWTAWRAGRLESPSIIRLDNVQAEQPTVYGNLYYDQADRPLPSIPRADKTPSPDGYRSRGLAGDMSLYGLVVEGRTATSQPPLPMTSATPQSNRDGSPPLLRSPWLDIIDQAGLGAGGTISLQMGHDDDDEDGTEVSPFRSTVGTSNAGKSALAAPMVAAGLHHQQFQRPPAFGGGELRRRREAASSGTSPMFDEDIGIVSPDRLQGYAPRGHVPAPYFSPMAPSPARNQQSVPRQFSPPPPAAWRPDEGSQRRQITFGDNPPPVASPPYIARPSEYLSRQMPYPTAYDLSGPRALSASPGQEASPGRSRLFDPSAAASNDAESWGHRPVGAQGRQLGNYYVDPTATMGDDYERL